MMQDLWNSGPMSIRPSKSEPSSPVKPLLRTRSDSFHVAHKIPVGDTPYVKAKRVQLVDKDPEKAIALFWAAINAGDRVDSALKDMAIVMKQQNRAEEAIEAIKSLRVRCTDQAQESLDNILLDLYKRCGRLDDQITLLKHKLVLIHQGTAFNGKRTKTARSQGKKFQVSLEQEATRLLGNLGWALMQQQNYIEAEAAYRRALLLGPDNNKMCNLGICLMKQGRIVEAKETLRRVRPAMVDGPRGVDSHLKAFERAQEMLHDLESELMNNARDKLEQSWLFNSVLGSSSIWQPQPCKDPVPIVMPPVLTRDGFADENIDVNRINAAAFVRRENSLNIDAKPFYLKGPQFLDPLANLKRARSGNGEVANTEKHVKPLEQLMQGKSRRRSLSSGDISDNKWLELLPDDDAFHESIVAAVLAPVIDMKTNNNTIDATNNKPASSCQENNMGKRLKVFQDITLSLSPRA
ncbi:hypothetical protein QJS10_CPB15g00427 [Acorus calamus]|uniref:Protein POLLENLESS 3-LIKE 2 n=1 Tax=Acorus calamus TaxID=4465 RepID=A0AAV9D7Z4_ACOCL|nr:hypothetical protein QJS10_CPB15g00427 [Acorus calamus]